MDIVDMLYNCNDNISNRAADEIMELRDQIADLQNMIEHFKDVIALCGDIR